MSRMRLRPDLLRSMLLTFGLYFFFRQQLYLLKEPQFYYWGGRAMMVTLAVLPVLVGFNSYRYGKGYFENSEVNGHKSYLLHPQRQWMVLLLMPLLVFVEEFLFRAGLLAYLMPVLGNGLALGISSLAFVLAHEQPLRLDKTNGLLFLYGLAFGAVYLWSGLNFIAAFIVHLAVNIHAWVINVILLRRAGQPLLPSRFSWQALWATIRV